MYQEPEQYFEVLLQLVKKELDLYTRYAAFPDDVREAENGMHSRKAYDLERRLLFQEWNVFHKEAHQSVKSGRMLPFAYMLHKLGLTEFEKYCVCLAAAPELDREFEKIYAGLQEERSCKYPTIDLCIKMFSADTCVRNNLIHQIVRRKALLLCVFQEKPKAMESELSWKLKLQSDLIEYIFFYESDLVSRKKEYVLCLPDGGNWQGLNVNRQIAICLKHCLEGEAEERLQLLILTGAAGSGKKLQVRLAVQETGRAVLFFDLSKIRQKSAEQQRECVRDAVVRAVLDQAYLCFCHWEALKYEKDWDIALIHEILKNAELFFTTVFLTTETEEQWEEFLSFDFQTEVFAMRHPDIRQQIRLWKDSLIMYDPDEKLSCETLAAQFDFTPGMIREVVEAAAKKTAARGAEKIDAASIYEACHQKISHRLGERASRVNASYTWDELVLEEDQKELLRQACGQITCRYRVYEEWGFRSRLAYGRGVSMLFAGPPGTGKTMAAQVLAKELNLELYKVDLSGVLSKYIGETQKNLRDIFDEVQKSRSILFFDEADALFGKRVNVTDSRDISANAQTAYLLQKIEEYDGITILATNLLQNFDDAYKRRIKYIIHFTFPQEEQRRQLWKKVFPAQMPLEDDVDTEYLASSFDLSGAAIKNIAVNAAFMAAAEQQITGMKHIMTALQQEYRKSGKTLGKEELKEYYIYKK